jgi:2-dehydro-3-deoxy-D-arabinonate dehydratase
MAKPVLIRFRRSGSTRLGLQLEDGVYDVTESLHSVADFLRNSAGRVKAAIDEAVSAARHSAVAFTLDQLGGGDVPNLLAPLDSQEIWAAGVTYERSRNARQEEAADGGDVYARVYAAARPELFFKGLGWRAVAHLGEVGIRFDSKWNVPEPELALVLNPQMEVVGLTVGNDMSSRDIEGANPLYLPQAKIYNGSCALGPGIALGGHTAWPITTIRIDIARQGAPVFSGSVETSRIHRTLQELVEHLGRCIVFPDGAVLLTGTGIVPPNEFTLEAGDRIQIQIEGVGTLVNTVKRV